LLRVAAPSRRSPLALSACGPGRPGVHAPGPGGVKAVQAGHSGRTAAADSRSALNDARDFQAATTHRSPYTTSFSIAAGPANPRSDSRHYERQKTQLEGTETQPLLNHTRRDRGSRYAPALHVYRSLTCSPTDKHGHVAFGQRSRRPLPRQTGRGPTGPGLTCGYIGGRSRVRTWVG